jgi:hypothetical protein
LNLSQNQGRGLLLIIPAKAGGFQQPKAGQSSASDWPLEALEDQRSALSNPTS